MSAHTADSQFSFRLPSLSYIDAQWEEPNLRAPHTAPQATRSSGLATWLSHRIAALMVWYRNHEAAAELAAMSDYELSDIGLSRSDLSRVFKPGFSQDMHRSGARG